MNALTGLSAWTDANAFFLWIAALVIASALTLWRSRKGDAVESRERGFAKQSRFLVVVLGAAGLFAALAATHRYAPLQAMDVAIGGAFALNVQAQGVARWITLLGQPSLLAVALGMGVAALLVFRRYSVAILFVLMVIANGCAVRALKALFERVRPARAEAFALGGDWSFPSGHAAGAMMVFGALGWFVARASSAGRRHVAAGIATVLVFAIGASRVVLEVHHASDVLAGFALGAAHLCLLIAMTRTIEARAR
ncbi:MAG: phosphatase PAP2 family protein [Dokdonella sp.]